MILFCKEIPKIGSRGTLDLICWICHPSFNQGNVPISNGSSRVTRIIRSSEYWAQYGVKIANETSGRVLPVEVHRVYCRLAVWMSRSESGVMRAGKTNPGQLLASASGPLCRCRPNPISSHYSSSDRTTVHTGGQPTINRMIFDEGARSRVSFYNFDPLIRGQHPELLLITVISTKSSMGGRNPSLVG